MPYVINGDNHQVTLEHVIRHFIWIELGGKKTSKLSNTLLSEIDSFVTRGDGDAQSLLKRFLEEAGDTGNPVGTWILEPARRQSIRSWTQMDIPLSSLYTNGVSGRVNEALESCGRMLVGFAPLAGEYLSEFNSLDVIPQGERQTLIVVRSAEDWSRGRLELIDGFHRAISMIRSGQQLTRAFVANLKAS